MKLCIVLLKMCTAHQLLSDGPSKAVNRMVESDTQCYCASNQNERDFKLSAAEFAYSFAASDDFVLSPSKISVKRNWNQHWKC